MTATSFGGQTLATAMKSKEFNDEKRRNPKLSRQLSLRDATGFIAIKDLPS
ncbi:MAG: hypothetical protein R2747_24355 [Pyrinomonadaceae bacterium]